MEILNNFRHAYQATRTGLQGSVLPLTGWPELEVPTVELLISEYIGRPLKAIGKIKPALWIGENNLRDSHQAFRWPDTVCEPGKQDLRLRLPTVKIKSCWLAKPYMTANKDDKDWEYKYVTRASTNFERCPSASPTALGVDSDKFNWVDNVAWSTSRENMNAILQFTTW